MNQCFYNNLILGGEFVDDVIPARESVSKPKQNKKKTVTDDKIFPDIALKNFGVFPATGTCNEVRTSAMLINTVLTKEMNDINRQ